ncbi:MAG: anaerobic ribonucleoside-triphosphate reductase activating protein [Patescibacteria group bacterium]
MKIGGFQKVSLLDFPAHLSAIVFVKGCNFRCPFCFNRDLVLGNLPTIFEGKIFSFLKKRKKVLDGVVITGGEPTLQPDLEKFIKKVKKIGYEVKLDTNGALPEILKNLIKKKIIDYLALDFKAPLNFSYSQITNYKLQITNIKKSIKLILQSGIPFELRTTVVPGIHNKKTLVLMAKQLRQITNYKLQITNLKWFLQEFQPKTCLDPEFEKIRPYSKIEMEKFLKAVKKIIPAVELR